MPNGFLPSHRPSVSEITKILYPHGQVSRDELGEILEFALEGRHRVKEQLNKIGSFEYYDTSFSYTLHETGEERFVGGYPSRQRFGTRPLARRYSFSET